MSADVDNKHALRRDEFGKMIYGQILRVLNIVH